MQSRREIRTAFTVLLVAVLFRIVMIGTPRARTDLIASFQSPDTPSVNAVIALLPVIFFDSASSDIPERYDLEPLPNGSATGYYATLHDAYLRVLDVLAEQLLTNQQYVVLQGFEERTDSVEDCYLARSRAERIRNYLVYDRGVDPRRIRVLHSNTRCLPPEISARDGRRLNCEYRRVEILTPARYPFPIFMHVKHASPAISQLNSSCVVTFDVHSDYLNRSQRQQLGTFLDAVPLGDELSIIANADVVGRSESASRIAPQRANRVAEFIRKVRPDCRITMGNNHSLQSVPLGLPSQDLPEIRYLCRSVVIQHRKISPEATR
ncbi:MAG: hypothetical protein FGM32_10035 [Candidatus Kapabacteria bacterium]|nr:hypothetical protein [Candidatus Kapabacteria bacterium]